jgi:hypothetical protein
VDLLDDALIHSLKARSAWYYTAIPKKKVAYCCHEILISTFSRRSFFVDLAGLGL